MPLQSTGGQAGATVDAIARRTNDKTGAFWELTAQLQFKIEIELIAGRGMNQRPRQSNGPLIRGGYDTGKDAGG